MADSTSRNESITEVVPKSLGKYLLDNVEGLKDYYSQFPAPNRQLVMPSVSVLFQNPDLTPNQSYEYEEIDPTKIVDSKARIKWVVGQYDGKIQLDLWARNKEERDDLTDAIFNALSPNITPQGLTLTLEEYFGILCDFLYVSHNFEDTEITSQTDEWRTTFDILVTCKAVRESKEFVIEDSSVVKEISTEFIVPE